MKTKTQNTSMRTGRQSAMVSRNETSSQGPGSYDVKGMSFGSNTKSFTIGKKRADRNEQSPGPGEYEVSRSDSVTKQRVPQAADFEKTTGRREESPARDSSSELGTVERFY